MGRMGHEERGQVTGRRWTAAERAARIRQIEAMLAAERTPPQRKRRRWAGETPDETAERHQRWVSLVSRRAIEVR